MKKPKVFFHPIAGSSVLSITWHDGPLGDAVEANNEIGVGFFAHNGDLLSVQFDDVEENDHQFLEFDHYKVDVTVKRGKVSYLLHEIKPKNSVEKEKIRKRA
jgi:hypothetical protein